MALAKAMLDAAHGAVLGRAIGDANDRADMNLERGMEWLRYARSLEQDVARLKHALIQEKKKNRELEDQLVKADQESTNLANNALNETHEKVQTFKRGREYKARLSQVEKALRHSGANTEALKVLLAPYKALIERLNLQGDLPADLEVKADEVWRKYLEGENLTNDPDIQAILDEVPLPPAAHPQSMLK